MVKVYYFIIYPLNIGSISYVLSGHYENNFPCKENAKTTCIVSPNSSLASINLAVGGSKVASSEYMVKSSIPPK